MNWSEKFRKMDYRNDYKPQVATVPRCKVCGHRKRGKNHDEGSHHAAKVR